LHGSNLIRDLRQRDPGLQFCGFAGPRMQSAGCHSLFDLTSLPIMFFAAVLWNIRTFRRLLREADQYFAIHPVDAVVLIDYPGFNWCIARRAKRHGIPVFYYGVPQMWAWGSWRIGKLRRLVDHVLCKLPFETRWFGDRKVLATWVGHPFFDEFARQSIDEDFVRRMSDPGQPLLLLLPGSRNREVDRNWPDLRESALRVCEARPETRVAVGCFSESQRHQVQADVDRHELPFDVFSGRTGELMRSATVAIACSGSVSLELMAARLPTVIVYRLTRFQHFLARRFLRCRFVTLVNLMSLENIERGNRPLHDPDLAPETTCPMPEYVYSNPSGRRESVAQRIAAWLGDAVSREKTRQWLDQIAVRHGGTGASGRAADYILGQLTARTAEKKTAA
jgi:lipid-A-disaccharide synthase